MMYTYKVKFQLGKMPYYVWVDAEDDDAAKAAAKKKVRAAYGRKRQYLHLSMENLGEATPLPADPPVVKDKVGEMVMPGDMVLFEDDKRGIVQLGHGYTGAADNFYKEGADYLYIDLDAATSGGAVMRLVKPKNKYSLDFMVLRESDAVQPDA